MNGHLRTCNFPKQIFILTGCMILACATLLRLRVPRFHIFAPTASTARAADFQNQAASVREAIAGLTGKEVG